MDVDEELDKVPDDELDVDVDEELDKVPDDELDEEGAAGADDGAAAISDGTGVALYL